MPRPTATSLTTRCCEPWCSHRARNRCVRATEGSSSTHEHRSPENGGAGRQRMWLMWRAAGPPPCVTTINQDALSGRSLYQGAPGPKLMGIRAAMDARLGWSQPRVTRPHVNAARQLRTVGHGQPRSRDSNASSVLSDERSRSPKSAFTFAEFGVQLQRNTQEAASARLAHRSRTGNSALSSFPRSTNV